MLNGYAYLGLSQAAEMLESTGFEEACEIKLQAEELKRNINQAFYKAMAQGVVVPLADETWCPTVSPWPGYHGPTCLHADGGNWFTHGTVYVRDSLTGPLYLVYHEVIDPFGQAANYRINYHTELMCSRNVAFSQPYYSKHPWIHLKRGERKPFLKNYYNMVSSMSDRETYTFFEHAFNVISSHKTHEEGRFLMQSRWMLYMEEGKKVSNGIYDSKNEVIRIDGFEGCSEVVLEF